MRARIAVLPGDGIGPEVVAAGLHCLRAVAARFRHEIELEELPFGGAAIDAHGDPLPPATLAACRAADAVLLGAIGGPRWADPDAPLRPESGLLRLRKELGVFANLRPVRVHAALVSASTLKSEVVEGVDLVFVRELTGGIYFGDKTRDAGRATDLCVYTAAEIERIVRAAARLARSRRRRLTSIDKANVLETSRLWRAVCQRVMEREFPDVTLEHSLVDAAAMHLIHRPRDFDVLVTENMFGDILSDLTAGIIGGMGMAPSADIGDRYAVFQPCHGTAPDIMGQGKANPTAMILSVAMMLDWLADKHGLESAAEAGERIERAVDKVYADGIKPFEFGGGNDTADVTKAVLAAL